MSNVHSSFLKEMGITEWVSKDTSEVMAIQENSNPGIPASSITVAAPQAEQTSPRAQWWFFGTKPQGDAQLLFQNLVRVLGLSASEWSWKSPADNLAQLQLPASGEPVVAFAFGGPAAQKITGERDPLPQLRETILALNTGNDDEIPVIASIDLAQAATKNKDKALLWQDLLLAKSVLQNI
jgi:hypothetical protein